MQIVRYQPEHAEEWNAFVKASKNGTFLIDRRYMDYHQERFNDHSLMFFDDQRLLAVLPAHVEGDTFYSHQGLTYGGLIMSEQCTAKTVCNIFEALNGYLYHAGINRVVYKAIPHIYHRQPSEEDLYALFRICKARLISRDVASVIRTADAAKWHRDRRYAANKSHTNGILVDKCDDYGVFWPILRDNLQRTYGAEPVRSLEEIERLHALFPDNIRLFVARKSDGTPLAGTVLYVTPKVVHAQYISASPEGKRLHAVDALYDRIIRHDFAQWPYIDFGKSSEEDGHVLNETLIWQKEGFGARAVCYDKYEWGISEISDIKKYI